MWVGFSVEIGPDGAVYILDWHDPDICGMSTMQKDTGRIFASPLKAPRASRDWIWRNSLTKELVDLQAHRNDWYVRRARVLLHERAVEGSLSKNIHGLLWNQFKSGPDTGRKLRSLWALHVTEGISQKQLTQLLDDKDAHIRSWAISFFAKTLSRATLGAKEVKTLAATGFVPGSPSLFSRGLAAYSGIQCLGGCRGSVEPCG